LFPPKASPVWSSRLVSKRGSPKAPEDVGAPRWTLVNEQNAILKSHKLVIIAKSIGPSTGRALGSGYLCGQSLKLGIKLPGGGE
jgi:hypothetical protein